MALGGYNDFFACAGTPGTYSDGGGGSLYGGQLPPHESREQFTLRAPQLSTSAGDSPQMDTPAPRGGKRSRMLDSDRSWENRQWGVVRAGMRLLGSATPEMFVASSAVWSILLEYRPDGAPDDAFVLGKVSRHPSGKFAQAVHRWMWTVSAEATLRAGSEDYVSMRSSRARGNTIARDEHRTTRWGGSSATTSAWHLLTHAPPGWYIFHSIVCKKRAPNLSAWVPV